MPITSNLQCKGYIMAKQHPSYSPSESNRSSPVSPISSSLLLKPNNTCAPPTTESNTKEDPYAILPCPYTVSVPPKLSARCENSSGARACWRLKYCEHHWCGPCKKASNVSRKVQDAVSAQQEERAEVKQGREGEVQANGEAV